MAPETNEFDRAEKTPARVIVTDKDVTIIRGSLRTIVKMTVPFLPKASVSIGAALVAWILSISHSDSNKAETEAKVQVAEKTTDRAFTAVVEPANKITTALNDALARIKALETTTAAQSAVIKEFTVEGRPASPRRRVDPELVKIVRQNAAKDSKELAARKAKPAPVLKAIPLEIPAAPVAGAPSVQAQQPAPPIPSPPPDAAKP